ncbi:MAG: hypothetical protein H7245_04935 [Candidatus Saccharibacteria bacterium]|nr:hypothetical protein [Pseudorhodobacter sp.]
MRQILKIVGFCLGFWACPLLAGETYDLLFKSGALDTLVAASKSHAGDFGLEYDRAISGSSDSSRLDLQMAPSDSVKLTLHQGNKTQTIGTFPASVGNPVILYFMETTLRDMAQISGGSPFYIRNRIKEALLREADIVPVKIRLGDRDISALQITLHPFGQDPNRKRMGSFADLALVVIVSEVVPGWYYSLMSTAPADPAGQGTGYSNAITLSSIPKDGP